METELQQYVVIVPDGAGLTTVNLQIPCYWDDDLKEWMMTPEGHKMIEDTKRAHGL